MVAGRRVVRIIEGFEGYGSEMERLEASEKKWFDSLLFSSEIGEGEQLEG